MRTASRSAIRNQRVRNKMQVMTTVCLILMAIFVVGCTEEDVQDSVKPQPSPAETSKPKSPQGAAQESSEILILTHSKSNYISFTNPATGIVEKLEVGKSPFGLALAAQGNRAYVSTAEGVSVVDTAQRQLIKTVPYLTPIPFVEYGEYRPGGMGIIVSPDDRYVYVGVYSSSRASQLEVLDTQTMAFVHKVPVGIRPFDVSVSLDGEEVYSIDHDSYSVTAVHVKSLEARKLEVAPFGKGGFEKPHYAVVREDGKLLMPYQGRGLAILDPKSGVYETKPLTGNTHQEGAALTADGKKLLIVGNGAAGSATGSPNLTVLDVDTMEERIIPLKRKHQMVAGSADGRYAYLTGGVTYADTGWDGMTIIDLQTGTTTEIALPDYPLEIEVLNK